MYIRTSHVGGFPLKYSDDRVKRVMDNMIGIGIDVPPYPQLRNFIETYLDPLLKAGVLELRNNNYYLIPSNIEAIRSVRPCIPEAEIAARYVKEKESVRWLRAPVTGVFTLASRIYVGSSEELKATLLSNKELMLDLLLPYVRSCIEYLASLGYNVVFIDEPILGVIVGKRRILFGYSEEDIAEVINKLFHQVPGEHGIHICGRISDRLFKMLVRIEELRLLNFEFHDTPQNIEVIDPKALQDEGKVIAPGVASSRKPVVENYSDINSILKKVYERCRGRIDMVSADCGFHALRSIAGSEEQAYAVGMEKLRRIVKVVRELSSRSA